MAAGCAFGLYADETHNAVCSFRGRRPARRYMYSSQLHAGGKARRQVRCPPILGNRRDDGMHFDTAETDQTSKSAWDRQGRAFVFDGTNHMSKMLQRLRPGIYSLLVYPWLEPDCFVLLAILLAIPRDRGEHDRVPHATRWTRFRSSSVL